MLGNVYITKVLKKTHSVTTTLTKGGLVSVLNLPEINLSLPIVLIAPNLNNMTIDVNTSEDWQKITDYLL